MIDFTYWTIIVLCWVATVTCFWQSWRLRRARLELLALIPHCVVCDHVTTSVVNGMAFCQDHAEDVLRMAVEIEAMDKGAPPEVAQQMVEKMIDDLRHMLGNDDEH